MATDDPWGLVGRRCTAVTRIVHQFTGEPASRSGPLEIAWDDGRCTVLDVRSDWTLSISDGQWTDPFAGASSAEREALGHEIGLWERQPVTGTDVLAALLGAQVSTVEPWRNEIGEFAGLDIEFNRERLIVRQFAGNLTVQVSPR